MQMHSNLPQNIKTNTIIPATITEKKLDQQHDANKPKWDAVPPLAPLSSGAHSNIRQTSIIATVQPTNVPKLDEDSNSTNLSAGSSIYSTNPATPSCVEDGDSSFAGFEGLIVPGGMIKKIGVEDEKDANNRQSHVVTSNKMLADLLDRKSSEPPFNISESGNKRKVDSTRLEHVESEPSVKRSSKEESGQTSSTTANLYAQLAASLLEDEEDMEIEDPTPITEPSAKSMTVTVPMQRQIIVSPNQPPQMILAPTPANPPIGQATATIKTESGYQTVPVILQHNNQNQMGNIQIQKQMNNMGQQMMQPMMQQQQTQYMLATNQQGQTYLVAQQQPQQMNQILLQTTQQQGGQPTKTIIILQQQMSGGQQTIQTTSGHQQIQGPGTPQKVIMTNQQGQQMIVTQVPRPMQHHVIVNQHQQHAMSTASNFVQNNPSISTSNSIINQVATGTLPIVNQQPQIVTQVQLQQSQSQLSLPLQNSQQSQQQYIPQHSQTVHIQKHHIQQQHPQQNQQQSNIQQSIIQQTNQQSYIQTQQHQSQISQQLQIQQKAQPQPQIQQQSQQQNQIQDQLLDRKINSTFEKKQVFVTGSGNIEMTEVTHEPNQPSRVTTPTTVVKTEDDVDMNWLYVCDWRGCQK